MHFIKLRQEIVIKRKKPNYKSVFHKKENRRDSLISLNNVYCYSQTLLSIYLALLEHFYCKI